MTPNFLASLAPFSVTNPVFYRVDAVSMSKRREGTSRKAPDDTETILLRRESRRSSCRRTPTPRQRREGAMPEDITPLRYSRAPRPIVNVYPTPRDRTHENCSGGRGALVRLRGSSMRLAPSRHRASPDLASEVPSEAAPVERPFERPRGTRGNHREVAALPIGARDVPRAFRRRKVGVVA